MENSVNPSEIAARVKAAQSRLKRAMAAANRKPAPTPAAIQELKAASAEALEASKALSDYFEKRKHGS